MRKIRITFDLEVPYEDDSKFLSDNVAALLRDIADHCQKAVRREPNEQLNPPNTRIELPTGAFSWRRKEP